MNQTVTFSMQVKGMSSPLTETFTLKELSLHKQMSTEKLENRVDAIFQTWVWSHISFSRTINH
ncbi:hypothetical protein [Cytobacillus kochii]|uniref:hypothetical protein n=1 Tax=Cytobacillus kochii TaxID=859143 RepID=UPI0025A214EF|nr:hypothetical protein [Cytobacillus kochii]MDM5205694.1 hypothetical protein [Cytobacillus kochii]